MVLVIIHMKVLCGKCMELSQAIGSLIGSIRTEKGCNRCDFCKSIEDENRLSLLGMGYPGTPQKPSESGRFRVSGGDEPSRRAL